jgi:hypothetical protein
MSDADGRTCFVDVLAACAACTVKIDSQILFVNFNIYVFIVFGQTINGGETRMASFVGIERTDSDETMDACLAGKFAEGKWAADFERYRTQTRLFADGHIELFVSEFILLEKSGVHPQKHTDPIAAFRSARAGVDTEKTVFRIVWAAEHTGQLDSGTIFFEIDKLLLGIGNDLCVIFGKCYFEKVGEVGDFFLGVNGGVNNGFQRTESGDDGLGGIWIVPKTRLRHLLCEVLPFSDFAGQVKASPGFLLSGP